MTAPAGFHRLHRDAAQLLGDWTAPDASQESLRTSFLRHLEQHPDAMWRGGPVDHFTASMFIFDRTLRRVVLALHKRAGLWLQVGGHPEEVDAAVAEAATREAVEESGIAALHTLPQVVHLDHHLLAGPFGRCRSHLDIRFAAIARGGAAPRCSAESDDVAWWPVDALPEPIDPALPEVIHTVRARLAHDAPHPHVPHPTPPRQPSTRLPSTRGRAGCMTRRG